MGSKLYAVGYSKALAVPDRRESVGIAYGPNPNLKDVLSFWPVDFDGDAFIFEFDDSDNTSKHLFKFNKSRKEWERIERVPKLEEKDPMLGDKFEVVLRSREEMDESLGEEKLLKSQGVFFGDKPDLRADDSVQFACFYHRGNLIRIYYDRLRLSDDDKLKRDLAWVKHSAEHAYKLGYYDGMSSRLSKPQQDTPASQEPPRESKQIKRIK